MRFPVIPLSLLVAAWFLGRSNDARLRITSLVTLAGLASLVLLFKTFFTYYLVLIMPWIVILFAVTAHALVLRLPMRALARRWQQLLVGTALLIGLAIPVAYDEVYYRTGTLHVASPAQIIPLLRQGNGYIYAMYPLFSLWSGRPEYPWYYSVDALIPRMTGRWTSADFIQAFAGSQAAVTYEGELDDFQEAQNYLNDEFELAYRDEYFALWVRPSPS
jgi:hypothetical protein